jgi:hypothetical protein
MAQFASRTLQIFLPVRPSPLQISDRDITYKAHTVLSLMSCSVYAQSDLLFRVCREIEQVQKPILRITVQSLLLCETGGKRARNKAIPVTGRGGP